jgi:molybdopterin synthase catalytic subunit
MFKKFFGLVRQDDDSERIESMEAKHFEAAKDWFETMYGERFTGEIWEEEK